jgi:hypothetical protein
MSAEDLFFRVFAATAAIKILFAAVVPLTGDEAYFVVWGRFPDYGYYDHGAMTGWWMHLTLLAGNSVLILRLPAVITSLLGALMLRQAVRPVDSEKANLVATLYLLSPVGLLNILFTADTPLLFFSLLAGWFAIRAVRRDCIADWRWAGLLLGFAVLTKYLAVLLGLAFAGYLLFLGGRRRVTGLLALLVGATPATAVNLTWNFNHGWTNVVFNAITRNADAGFSPLSFLQLIAFVVVVFAGPVLVYFLLRANGEGRLSWRDTWFEMRKSSTLVALFAVGIPGAVFIVLSLVRPVGLHWLISFYPFFFLVLAAKFDAAALQRQIRPVIVYAYACSAAGLVLLALPAETYRWHRSYNSFVLGRFPEEVLAQLAPYSASYSLMTPSYTQSAQLGFHSGRHVPVIGPGSFHGRQDDFITDFRTFDGRDLMVLSARARDAAATHEFFESVESREINVHGSRIALVLGRGFKFAAYREAVLQRVARDYYRLPRWLAGWSRPAPFISRYGLESAAAP